ncbi:MAG: 2-phospho-L-lactate transferase CofD family protein, partial [Thermodesulfobacteriota bacterium]
MITALGGGVGAAKFLAGLTELPTSTKLNVIINTGDDIDIYGLRVSPDIDTVIYRLSGKIDSKKGWGLSGDSFNFLKALSDLGVETWFNIGDKDLATHLFKMSLRRAGFDLNQITKITAEKFGLKSVNVIPMTNDHVETWINTEEGKMHFQEYYIKNRMEPLVKGVELRGKEHALPAPGVIDSIRDAEYIIICPSNPIISIGPILEIKGIRNEIIQ